MDNYFSKNISYLRKRDKLSLRAMGEIVGKNKSVIEKYEKGDTEPGISVIQNLAHHYKLPLSYILEINLSLLYADVTGRAEGGAHTKIEEIKPPLRSKTDTKAYMKKDPPQPGHWAESDIETYTKSSGKPIPFHDMEVTASSIELFNDGPGKPSQFISIPGFDDCDFAFNLWGDSMRPIYCSGDIILCKKIKDKNVIQFGEVYLVVTSEMRTVKYIKKHIERHLWILESANDFYDSFEIETDRVIHLYLVKGKVIRNAI